MDHRFTFSVDSESSALATNPGSLDIMLLEDWLPVGKLTFDPFKKFGEVVGD